MPQDRQSVEEIFPELKASTVDWTVDIRMSVVKLMLSDHSFFVDNARQLKPEYFPDEISQVLLDFTTKYFKAYKQLPPQQIVYDEMWRRFKDSGDWPEYQYQLANIYDYVEPVANQRDYLRDRVTDFCKEESMKAGLRRCYDLVLRPEKGRARYEEMSEIFREALSVGADVEAGDFYYKTYKERLKAMMAAKEAELDKFSMGFDEIDKALEGGLNRKEIGLIAGLSGSGKSFLLIWIAARLVMAGRKVLFITLENSKLITMIRFDACFTMIPTHMICDTHHKKDDNKNSVIDERLEQVFNFRGGDLHVAEFPMGKTSIEDLEAYEQQLQTRLGWHADAVILDYLDELKMPSGLDLHLAQAEVLGKFKGWMQQTPRDIGMVGVTATQVNRPGAAVSIITEQHFASSFNKIFKVDACWSINRNDADKEMGLMRIFVVKHRNARSHFLVFAKANYENCQFKEITEEQYTKLVLQAKGGDAKQFR